MHSTAYLRWPRCPLGLTTHSYLLPDAAPLGSEGDPVFSPLLGTLCKGVGFPFPRGRCISLVAAGGDWLLSSFTPTSNVKLSSQSKTG